MQKLDLTKLNLSLNPGLVNSSLSPWLKLAKINIKLGFSNQGLNYTNLCNLCNSYVCCLYHGNNAKLQKKTVFTKNWLKV